MSEKKLLFVLNPKAGKARIKNHLLEIVDIFNKAGYEVTVCVTQEKGDAVRLVETRTADYDLLVCSGGDGTLDEVVTGMVKSGRSLPVGYIPAGSTNDFANSLNLPKNMKKAAEVIVTGRPFACDIASFNRGLFVYVAAFGMFTDVSYETGQEMKNVLGHMAYILEGVKSLTAVKAYRMRFTYDNNVIEGNFLFGMITNSVSVGGFKKITGKNVELNDGELEVTLVRLPGSLTEMNQLIGALAEKDSENAFICWFKTSRLQIESEEEIAWTLDGEYGGPHKEVLIEDYREAMQIMVPGTSVLP